MAPRVTELEKRRMRKLRDDGHSLSEIGRRVGRNASTVADVVGMGFVGKVSNEPLRQAFLESGKPAAEVARRLGWESTPGKADTARVRRALGLLPDLSGSTGARSWRQRIDAETAELIGEVVGVAPWELEAAA